MRRHLQRRLAKLEAAHPATDLNRPVPRAWVENLFRAYGDGELPAAEDYATTRKEWDADTEAALDRAYAQGLPAVAPTRPL
jgi:hypothetical protein